MKRDKDLYSKRLTFNLLSPNGQLIHHDFNNFRASSLQQLCDGRSNFGRESTIGGHQRVEHPMELTLRSHLKGVRATLDDEKVAAKVEQVAGPLASARLQARSLRAQMTKRRAAICNNQNDRRHQPSSIGPFEGMRSNLVDLNSRQDFQSNFQRRTSGDQPSQTSDVTPTSIQSIWLSLWMNFDLKFLLSMITNLFITLNTTSTLYIYKQIYSIKWELSQTIGLAASYSS